MEPVPPPLDSWKGVLGMGCVGPGWERHLLSCAVCWISSLLPLCSWGGSWGRHGGQGGRAQLVPSQGPLLPTIRKQEELCRGASTTDTVLEAVWNSWFRVAGTSVQGLGEDRMRSFWSWLRVSPWWGLGFPRLYTDWIWEEEERTWQWARASSCDSA